MEDQALKAVRAGKKIDMDALRDLYVETHVRSADFSDAFVAMPGGLGTWEEFFEVLTWSQLGLHRKPCGLLNIDGYFNSLLALFDTFVEERFARRDRAAVDRQSRDDLGQAPAARRAHGGRHRVDAPRREIAHATSSATAASTAA